MASPRQASPGPGPETVRTVAGLRARTAAWRRRGQSLALVPTMGGLHAGHMALVEAARGAARRTVVSLFVNPAQFGPDEDVASYPRDEAGDAAKLARAGVDLLYAPSEAEVYGEGFATSVSVGGLASGLCGPHRPGHFEAVATVVAKLLIACAPDLAFFGEKDYQQFLVVRRLARDLDLPVEIRAVATVREPDGLALSSRNAYLDACERLRAGHIPRVLAEVVRRLGAGEAGVGDALAWGRAELARAGIERLDYLELCDAETLAPLTRLGRPARVFVAARIGRARLIDNMEVPG